MAENLYNLRYVSEFSRPMVKSVYNGTGSISYLGRLEKLKDIEKKEIKPWKPDN